MKLFCLIFVGALLCTLVQGKTVDKSNPKKTKAAKPSKTPKTILDYFENLNKDDQGFIKDLDKQFNDYGDKIKIKIEKDNNTASNKNSKRTIDGELAYGYNQNQYDHGYQFSKLQYSPSNLNGPGHRYTKPAYGEVATDIEIQRSHSYELGPDEYNQHQGYTQESQPVIVLKIPGPARYAEHLQALLQQYLEIRAAQFVQELEEQERLQAGYQQQFYSMVQVAPNVFTSVQPQYYQASYQQPSFYEPQQNYYPEYQTKTSKFSVPNYDYEADTRSVIPLPKTEYRSAGDYSSVSSLKTVENYPSDKHTRVIFKDDKVPYNPEQEYTYEDPNIHVESVTAVPEFVEITQRTPYHFHSPSRSSKRNAPYSEEEFKKYNHLIQKLKKQNSVKVIH